MSLAMEPYNDDDGGGSGGGSLPVSQHTPMSWAAHLLEVPVMEPDDPATLRLLTRLDAAHRLLPDLLSRADFTRPVMAMFRNANNTQWLVVELDASGVAARLVVEETNVDSAAQMDSLTASYFPRFFVGEGYVERASVRPPLITNGVLNATHLLAIFIGAALHVPLSHEVARGAASAAQVVELSETLTRLIDATLALSTVLVATRQLNDGEFVSVMRGTNAASAHDAADATRLLRSVYSTPVQHRLFTIAALLVETLFDAPLVWPSVIDPISWANEYLPLEVREELRYCALRTDATNVAELVGGVRAAMAPLRAVLPAAYRYAMRVSSMRGAPAPPSTLAGVRRLLEAGEPVDGVLLLMPGVVELYQLFGYDGRRVLRQYFVTADESALQYADLDESPGLEAVIDVAEGAAHAALTYGDWQLALREQITVDAVYRGAALIAPLTVTLGRMSLGTMRTEATFYVVGLLALARWLAETARGGARSAESERDVQRQFNTLRADERRLIMNARLRLFGP